MLNKNFREDLYYRLRSVNIYIPPLRERKSDIKILFDNFINNYCKENNIEYKGIEDDAMDFLLNYNWPGNARELKNFCESIVVLYPDHILTFENVKKLLHLESDVTPRSLPILFSKQKESYEKDFLFRALLELKSDIIDIKNYLGSKKFNTDQPGNVNEDFVISKERFSEITMNDIEKEALLYLLENNYWNVEKVSGILQQTPRNVYRKMKLYDISREHKWKE